MRTLKEIDAKISWIKSPGISSNYLKFALIKLPSGTQAQLVVGFNENGWEHVSMEVRARRLPTWEEMCFVKDIFWDEEELVIQMHPKKSQYVNLTDALHLWRPVNGDWSLLNEE